MNVVKMLILFIILQLFYACGPAGALKDDPGRGEAIAFTGMKIYTAPGAQPTAMGTVLVETRQYIGKYAGRLSPAAGRSR